MEDKMYVFYLKTDRVVTVIGDTISIDYTKNYIDIFRNQKLQAEFMRESIEGFITKNIGNNTEVTENDTRNDIRKE
jgi:hypothetical protein